MAVNKPSGVLVHRSKIDPRATAIALQMVRDQVGQHVYPVHRLDKSTSGVLLFGLNKSIAQQLAGLFADRQIQKSYLAIVRGFVDQDGLIDYALKEILDRKTDKKARQDKPPQSAVTAYTKLDQVELPFAVGRYQTARYSLVQLNPKTGRKNQLRRHMKHIFHPIVGDRKFGDWRHNKFIEEQFGCRQLMLHAASLLFTHPLTEVPLVISAQPDETFSSLVDKMGFSERFK